MLSALPRSPSRKVLRYYIPHFPFCQPPFLSFFIPSFNLSARFMFRHYILFFPNHPSTTARKKQSTSAGYSSLRIRISQQRPRFQRKKYIAPSAVILQIGRLRITIPFIFLFIAHCSGTVHVKMCRHPPESGAYIPAAIPIPVRFVSPCRRHRTRTAQCN